MRDIPDTSGGGDLRPFAAVALGALLVVGAFAFVTSGAAPAGSTDTDLRVNVTATAVDAPPADADVRSLDEFEPITPVHRAVLRSDSVNGTATYVRRVDDAAVVGLDAGEDAATFYVSREADDESGVHYARVHVQRLGRVEN